MLVLSPCLEGGGHECRREPYKMAVPLYVVCDKARRKDAWVD